MQSQLSKVAELEQFVSQMMADYRVPGLALAVRCGAEVVYAKGFGYSDLAKSAPVSERTVFGIGSITKSFTALAITLLVERGLVALNDPVIAYLPEFCLSGVRSDRVTIHQLLTHTSGLPPTPAMEYAIATWLGGELAVNKPGINTSADLLRFLARDNVAAIGEPGRQFSYSNDGYALLGAIIARTSGMTYQEFVQEHILRPLHLTRSGFNPEQIGDDVTELYRRTPEGDVVALPSWQQAPPFEACATLTSSASDLLKYLQVYPGHGNAAAATGLSPGAVERMLQGVAPYNLACRYGYGWRVQDNYHGVKLVEHGGAWRGVSAHAGFAPEQGISAVVLCNIMGVPVAKLWLAAINLALGLPITTSRYEYCAQDWSEQFIDAISGYYRSGEGSEMLVQRGRDRLVGCYGGNCYSLTPVAESTALLRVKQAEYEIGFLTGQDGRVWALTYNGRIVRRQESR